MLSGIAIIVDPETTPQTVQEHSGERYRQLRVLLFAKSESRPKIHEPAGARLHVEKHLGTIGLIFGLTPFVWIRREGHREIEGAIDGNFHLALNEPIESAAQELCRLLVASGPIGRIANSEFEQDGCEASNGCIAAKRGVAQPDMIESRNAQAWSGGDQPGGTSPAGAFLAEPFRP
jgi:hypothetical protein